MITHHATSVNLASVLEHTAMLTPDRVAVCGCDLRLTYAEIDEQSSRVAAGLVQRGIGPGEHVVLSCPNVPWFPIAYFGILKAGAVVVPINVLLKPREIVYHLRDSDAKAMIAYEGTPELPMAQMANAACQETGRESLIIITADPAAASPISDKTTLAQLMRATSRSFEMRRRRLDDTAVILYTSGTTGHPKGAELTHENMLLNAIASRDMFLPCIEPALSQPVGLVTLPLFHSTAQTCLMNAGFYGGFRLVLLPRFDPADAVDTMRHEQVNIWVGVPTMYWSVLNHVRNAGIDPAPIAASLSLCASGGAPMPLDVLHGFEATFGVRILEGYGLSETSPVACFNQVHRPSKPGTVGQPIFGVEVRCVDEQGMPVATGERGEIVIRGPNVMKGYYKRPDATAEVMRSGWFHTGDIGTLDADGYLSIVDRKKDLIIRGGHNVYPRELEEVIMTHPDISLAAVVGIPDERLGEEVKAFVVRTPGSTLTEQQVIDWCREQFAGFKYPRFVEFRDSLPIGATGKVLKRALRAQT